MGPGEGGKPTVADMMVAVGKLEDKQPVDDMAMEDILPNLEGTKDKEVLEGSWPEDRKLYGVVRNMREHEVAELGRLHTVELGWLHMVELREHGVLLASENKCFI